MKTLKMTVSEVRKTLEKAFDNALSNGDIEKALNSKGLRCPVSITELQSFDPEEQVEMVCMWNNIG